jgi:GNAT superfamily N-acetyltransferase
VIRAGTIDDAPALHALVNAVYLDRVMTVAGWRHTLAEGAERAQAAWFAALEGDRLVGWASTGLEMFTSEPGVAWMHVTVHPDTRREGLGTALHEAAVDRLRGLDARRVLGSSRDDDDTIRFLEDRGWTRTGEQRISAVDPHTVEPASPPRAVELAPFSAFAADPRPLYEVDIAASEDMPLDAPFDNVSFDDWLRQWWSHPDVDHDVSAAVLVGGVPVAISMMRIDRAAGRAANDITGTLREHRGRGLATLVKREALRRAAEAGATVVITENDETNAAMLRVNERLGYKPHSRRVSWVKELA